MNRKTEVLIALIPVAVLKHVSSLLDSSEL